MRSDRAADEKTSLREAISRNGSHRGDGDDLASEALIEVSARLEHDGLSKRNLGDLFFRHSDLGVHSLDLMNFGEEFAFLEVVTEAFFEAMRGHDTGDRADNAQALELSPPQIWQVPRLAIIHAHKLVGLMVSTNLFLFGVPDNFSPSAISDVTQMSYRG